MSVNEIAFLLLSTNEWELPSERKKCTPPFHVLFSHFECICSCKNVKVHTWIIQAKHFKSEMCNCSKEGLWLSNYNYIQHHSQKRNRTHLYFLGIFQIKFYDICYTSEIRMFSTCVYTIESVPFCIPVHSAIANLFQLSCSCWSVHESRARGQTAPHTHVPTHRSNTGQVHVVLLVCQDTSYYNWL